MRQARVAPVQQLAVEGPDVEAVLHGVHGGDGGGHVAAGGIPVDVGAHEVLRGCERLHLVGAEELQLAVEALEARQHQVAAGGRPENGVGGLALERGQVLELAAAAVAHRVEGHVRPRALAVDDAEAVALRLPRKGDDLLSLDLQLQNLHGALALLDAEQLKARVRRLLRLGEAVHCERAGARERHG